MEKIRDMDFFNFLDNEGTFGTGVGGDECASPAPT